MRGWRNLLPPEVPAFGRLAFAYAELLAADLDIAGAALRRRARAAILCAGCAVLSAACAVAWLLAGTWNTPYRYVVLGALTCGFAAIAFAVGRYGGLWGARKAALFAHVRSEWRTDQAALARLLAAPTVDTRGHPL